MVTVVLFVSHDDPLTLTCQRLWHEVTKPPLDINPENQR